MPAADNQTVGCAAHEVGSHRGHHQRDHLEAVPGRSVSGQDGSAFQCGCCGTSTSSKSGSARSFDSLNLQKINCK